MKIISQDFIKGDFKIKAQHEDTILYAVDGCHLFSNEIYDELITIAILEREKSKATCIGITFEHEGKLHKVFLMETKKGDGIFEVGQGEVVVDGGNVWIVSEETFKAFNINNLDTSDYPEFRDVNVIRVSERDNKKYLFNIGYMLYDEFICKDTVGL